MRISGETDKKMRAGGFIICLLSGIIVVTAGCGNQGARRGTDAGMENAGEMAEQNKEKMENAGETAEQNDGTEFVDTQTRTLTDEELAAFTEYINEGDNGGNYGFLMSVYDTPADINLDELFYSGAGIAMEALDENERTAYLEEAGSEEVYTDMTHLTTAQIDTFLKEKTGFGYSEMNHPLGWTYVAEYDSYYFEHGDTNYMAFDCISGMVENGETYILRFRPKSVREEVLPVRGYHVTDCEAVLKKTVDGYQFVSNRMINEEGQIAEQTFEVELAPLGKVTFASYEPDFEYDPYCDVTFVIIKDGVPYEYLPPRSEENMLAAAESFDSVSAVAFPDYNGDGYLDVIAIVNYSYVQGPDAGTGYTQVRVYPGNEYGYFELDQELSNSLTAMEEEKTIAVVLERIAEMCVLNADVEDGL